MRYLLLLAFVLLYGCASTPPATIKPKWPGAPEELMQACPDLQVIPDNTEKLSDVIIVVSGNYANYKICKEKLDSWIDWYNSNKTTYESIK
jgi:hypothetical protein